MSYFEDIQDGKNCLVSNNTSINRKLVDYIVENIKCTVDDLYFQSGARFGEFGSERHIFDMLNFTYFDIWNISVEEIKAYCGNELSDIILELKNKHYMLEMITVTSENYTDYNYLPECDDFFQSGFSVKTVFKITPFDTKISALNKANNNIQL